MAIELAPVGTSPLPHMYVPEGRTFTVGRAVQSEIVHQGISRRHCELFWADKPELSVTALKKRMIVVQPNGPLCKIIPNSEPCQVCSQSCKSGVIACAWSGAYKCARASTSRSYQ